LALGLVGSNRYKQASETTSHVLCDCKTLAVLRSGTWAVVSWDQLTSPVFVSKTLHFIQSAGVLNAKAKGCTNDLKRSRCMGHCGARPTLMYSVICLEEIAELTVRPTRLLLKTLFRLSYANRVAR